MHYEILAEANGTVREVMAEAGKQVAAEDVLIEIEVNADA
jgi:biotin carboxyl carrier protein